MINDENLTFTMIDKLFVDLIQNSIDDMQFTTSQRIIKERIILLESNISTYRNFKLQAINQKLEYEANAFLYMQCTIQAIHSTFLTFELIRHNSNLKAWGKIIDAQEYIDIAIKARCIIKNDASLNRDDGILEICNRIQKIEKGLFPSHKLYNSPAFIESIGKCSICHTNFLNCEHIEGEIYMGCYCIRIDRKIVELNHVALVENPRDRRCINTSKHNNLGQAIDVFSREPLKDKLNKDTFRGIIYHMEQLKIN